MSTDGAANVIHQKTAENAVHEGSPSPSGGGASESCTALTVAETPETSDADGRDTRLDCLPMQLDVMVRVRGMRVEDLLALENGTVLETVHDHTQDVPVKSGGALLVWGEFEVLDEKLAVRITRLA